MLNWYVYGEHAPFYYGKEKGIFAAEGIDLDIQEGRGSAVTVQAVAAKTVPFGYADVPTMIRAAVKGAPVVAAGRRAAEEPHVGHGLCREEHPEAGGHQGQDRRDDARRFDVADLAAVPQEDRPQGERVHASSRATPRRSSTPSSTARPTCCWATSWTSAMKIKDATGKSVYPIMFADYGINLICPASSSTRTR